jgi:hypothetical protein
MSSFAWFGVMVVGGVWWCFGKWRNGLRSMKFLPAVSLSCLSICLGDFLIVVIVIISQIFTLVGHVPTDLVALSPCSSNAPRPRDVTVVGSVVGALWEFEKNIVIDQLFPHILAVASLHPSRVFWLVIDILHILTGHRWLSGSGTKIMINDFLPSVFLVFIWLVSVGSDEVRSHSWLFTWRAVALRNWYPSKCSPCRRRRSKWQPSRGTGRF